MARYVADARARFPLPFDIKAVDNGQIEKQTLDDRLNSLNLSDYDSDVLDRSLASLVYSYSEQGVAQLLLGVATCFGDWGAFFETASVWPVEDGTKRLIDAIVAESNTDLRLSTPAIYIEDDGSGVTVTTNGGRQIRAGVVIVAMPINTLGEVTIAPDLPRPARVYQGPWQKRALADQLDFLSRVLDQSCGIDGSEIDDPAQPRSWRC